MDIAIHPVTEADRAFWFSLDHHLSDAEYTRKVRDQMGYVLALSSTPIAILRWSLFWDSIPFCNLLFVEERFRRNGFGQKLTSFWEEDMQSRGYDLVMTSTQSDEAAQHFWRRLGYRDCGGLMLPFPGHDQPMELILGKALAAIP